MKASHGRYALKSALKLPVLSLLPSSICAESLPCGGLHLSASKLHSNI